MRTAALIGLLALAGGCHLLLPLGGEARRSDGSVRDGAADADRLSEGAHVDGWTPPLEARAGERGLESGSDLVKLDSKKLADLLTAPGSWVSFSGAALTFTMGSPVTEPCRELAGIKETQHLVTLTHAFAISATEIQQAQFTSVMGYAPSTFASCGPTCPVETVSWSEAAAYCNALSAAAGLGACYSCTGSGPAIDCVDPLYPDIYACPGYRLPTEAEWELAYRAGTTSAYYSGTNDSKRCQDQLNLDPNAAAIGWYVPNTAGTPHAAAQKLPNTKGLVDMAGNVTEWCHDSLVLDLGTGAVTDPSSSTGTMRAFRGGSWLATAHALRAAHRSGLSPVNRNHYIGFRCARSL